MNSWKRSRSGHVLYVVVNSTPGFCPVWFTLQTRTLPQYDHAFLIVMESEPYGVIMGNQYAPIMNALAKDYGLLTYSYFPPSLVDETAASVLRLSLWNEEILSCWSS